MESEADGSANMRFEDALSALQDVVRRLESDDLPLEETLALFQRGTVLARRCGFLLDQAEQRVVELTETMQQDLGADEVSTQ